MLQVQLNPESCRLWLSDAFTNPNRGRPVQSLRRLTALAGSAIIVSAGFTAATATPAAAASCVRAVTISNSYGSVTYTRCWMTSGGSTYTSVSGSVKDKNLSDDWRIRGRFSFTGGGSYTTTTTNPIDGTATFSSGYFAGGVKSATVNRTA